MGVRLAATFVVFAGAAFAVGAAAEPSDASLSANQRRAIAASGLPRASIVSVKPDMVVAIRSRGTPSAGGGVIDGVVLQGEVVSSNAAQVMGYRSMRSTVNVDCVRRRDLVVKMAVYSEPNAQGEVVNRQVPGGWVQPSPDAYLSDVMRSICASVPRTAVAETPAVAPTKVRSAPAPKETPAAPVVAPVGPPTSISPPARTRTAMLNADRPVPTSVDARMARGDEHQEAVAPPPSREHAEVRLRPMVAPPPPAPPKKAPTAPKAAAPKPAASKPSAPGKISVQIAASPTEAQAREALARVKGKVKAPLSTSVHSVTVDGKVYHRALINGFQNRAEAQAFCGALGGGCFIR